MYKYVNEEKKQSNVMLWIFIVTLIIFSGMLFFKINDLTEKIEKHSSVKINNKEDSNKVINLVESNDINNKIDIVYNKENDNIFLKNTKENEIEFMDVNIPKYVYIREKNEYNIIYNKYNIKKTSAKVNATVKKLFELNANKNNKWNGLQFSDVVIENEVAIIKLIGHWKLDNNNNKDSFLKEIESSVLQYGYISYVRVLLNGEPFDWCIVDGDKKIKNKKCLENEQRIWDTSLIDISQENENNIQNTVNITKEETKKKYCNELFDKNIEKNSYMMNNLDLMNKPVLISDNFELKGCLRKYNGDYDGWVPFEGYVGWYYVKNLKNDTLTSGPLLAEPVNNEKNWKESIDKGSNVFFKNNIRFDFSSVAGEYGILEIQNENPKIGKDFLRKKTYDIVFGK